MTIAKWSIVIALATLMVAIIGVVGTWVAPGGSGVTADRSSVAAGRDAVNNMIAPGVRQ